MPFTMFLCCFFLTNDSMFQLMFACAGDTDGGDVWMGQQKKKVCLIVSGSWGNVKCWWGGVEGEGVDVPSCLWTPFPDPCLSPQTLHLPTPPTAEEPALPGGEVPAPRGRGCSAGALRGEVLV